MAILYTSTHEQSYNTFFLSTFFAWIPVSSFPTSTLPCLYQLYSALLTYPHAILFSWQFTLITMYVYISILMESWTQVSCIAGRFFTVWATREGPWNHKQVQIYLCICMHASHQIHHVKPQTFRLLFSLLKAIAKYSNSCIWIILISFSWHLSLRDFSLVLSSCFTFLILIHLNSLSFIIC